MGQKTHPNGLRLGIIKTWDSQWFVEKKKDFSKFILNDMQVRRYLSKRFEGAQISKIEIRRTKNTVEVLIHTARPGVIIGRKGEVVDGLKEELKIVTKKDVHIEIIEIKRGETDAKLVAENIARQLEKRVTGRRAMKRAIQNAMRFGVEGIRIQIGGRLGGAEIARVEKYAEGRVPLHTLRADIDYATATARTLYGTNGVKVWIMHGEKLRKGDFSATKQERT